MLFLVGDANIKKNAWELMKSNDGLFNASGAKILATLYKCSKYFKKDEVDKIMSMFKK
jgi:hypothetical protein